MATQAQADNCKYQVEKHYTDGTKETFSHYFVRCWDKNNNYCEWRDDDSASDADGATLLTNAKNYFKANCSELPVKVKPIDEIDLSA